MLLEWPLLPYSPDPSVGLCFLENEVCSSHLITWVACRACAVENITDFCHIFFLFFFFSRLALNAEQYWQQWWKNPVWRYPRLFFPTPSCCLFPNMPHSISHVRDNICDFALPSLLISLDIISGFMRSQQVASLCSSVLNRTLPVCVSVSNFIDTEVNLWLQCCEKCHNKREVYLLYIELDFFRWKTCILVVWLSHMTILFLFY